MVAANQMPTSRVLDAALEYAERGWPVFRLRPRDKTPIDKRGFKTATRDASAIRAHWSRVPEPNIGVPTGAESGFFALDIDGEEGEAALRALIEEHGPLPETVEALTGGGGHHLLFRFDPARPVRNSAGRLGAGLDVRGEGGYIVVPPSVHPSGRSYEWEVSHDPADVPIADPPEWLLDRITGHAQDATAPRERTSETTAEPILNGRRNTTLASIAGSLRRNGLSPKAIRAALMEVNRERCRPPLSTNDVSRIAASIGRYEPARDLTDASEEPPCLFEQFKRDSDRWQDTANARRFAEHWRSDAFFAAGNWYVWDGARWRRDDTGRVVTLATMTARSLWREAANAVDDGERKAAASHARRSCNEHGVNAMLNLARPLLARRPDELDPDPWLFNVANGTLDLRTGTLRPHRADDLLTMVSPVVYDPGARSAEWDAFLAKTTGGDLALTAFLQRLAGYALTGDIREEKFGIVHGPAASGKSTFLDALRAMWGDYGTSASPEAFLRRRDGGGPRNDLAALRGKRLVLALEIPDDREFDAAPLKALTGGDQVSVRFLYGEFFMLRPTFKILFGSNSLPRVAHDDGGMWRRILTVPFAYPVPEEERDPRVKAVLTDPAISGSAILNWALEGCLAWKRNGLGMPPAVIGATAEYRRGEDPLSDFLKDCAVLAAGATVEVSEFYRSYEEWARDNGGQRLLSKRALGNRLRRDGVTQERRGSGIETVRYWRGIGLQAESWTGEP